MIKYNKLKKYSNINSLNYLFNNKKRKNKDLNLINKYVISYLNHYTYIIVDNDIYYKAKIIKTDNNNYQINIINNQGLNYYIPIKNEILGLFNTLNKKDLVILDNYLNEIIDTHIDRIYKEKLINLNLIDKLSGGLIFKDE